MRSGILLLAGLALACGARPAGPAGESPGPGVAEADLGLRARGADLFEARGCAACHTLGAGALVGPDLGAVSERREREWIAAMIRRPDSMLARDPVAREVGAAFAATMPRLGIAPEEARALVAFLSDPEPASGESPPSGASCPGPHGRLGPCAGHGQGARRESPHPCRPIDPTPGSAFVPTDATSAGL